MNSQPRFPDTITLSELPGNFDEQLKNARLFQKVECVIDDVPQGWERCIEFDPYKYEHPEYCDIPVIFDSKFGKINASFAGYYKVGQEHHFYFMKTTQ